MRLAIAGFCLCAGVYWFDRLLFPYGIIAFLLSAAGGYCVLLRKTCRVILRYGRLTWTKEEVVRHILITGDIGSGKTTSGFHSILFQLTQNVSNWGGLVLGVKGNEAAYIHELLTTFGRASDHINLEVRPSNASTNWEPPHRYNLLSDRQIPWMTHAKIIVDIAASMTSGQQHSFFRPMAQIALANAFALIEEHDRPVTLTRAYEILSSPETAARYINKFTKPSATDKQRALAEFFKTNFTAAKAYEQREAVSATITTYLGFFMNSDVAKVFCSEEKNTFSFDEINRGSVLTLSMPQTLATERRYIQTYLKILFYIHALRRLDKPQSQRRNENLLLLVADEFQGVVTSSDDGISDYNVIDRIREANAALIAGMQSELSLDPVIGERKRKVLTLNLRTRFIFRAADPEGATASADFIGKRTIWKHTRSSKPLSPTTVSKRQEEEYYMKPEKLLRIKDHTAIITHPWKTFIKKKIAPTDGLGEIYPWFK